MRITKQWIEKNHSSKTDFPLRASNHIYEERLPFIGFLYGTTTDGEQKFLLSDAN